MNTVEHKYLTIQAREKLWTKNSAESGTKSTVVGCCILKVD